MRPFTGTCPFCLRDFCVRVRILLHRSRVFRKTICKLGYHETNSALLDLFLLLVTVHKKCRQENHTRNTRYITPKVLWLKSRYETYSEILADVHSCMECNITFLLEFFEKLELECRGGISFGIIALYSQIANSLYACTFCAK